jgi:hypothetical protein
MSDHHYKILLVEDNPGDARLVRESLCEARENPFDIEVTDRLGAGVNRLRAGKIDAVLLDLSLPDSQGAATFLTAKAVSAGVPIIVLTGQGDEALAVKLVQDGAQDYVEKAHLGSNNLSRAIRYAIGRAKTEQDIRKLNAELEQRVQQRTAELEASNKELEAFSHSVSHDLRAPLRHIDGFVRILVESEEARLGPPALHCVTRILAGVQSMTAIIDALLKLARVSRQPLEVRRTSLNELVSQAIEELGTDRDGRAVHWQIGDLPFAQCDRGLMKQVFTNLLSNALKYTRSREISTIAIGQTVIDGALAIFVRDNGAGFDMKYADKLFEQFQRLHRHEEFEGTGIGLATVQRIVYRHGGRIWAEASVDEGATFYFTGGLEASNRPTPILDEERSGFEN